MTGSIRSYDSTIDRMIERIKTISTSTAEAMGCKAIVGIEKEYDPVVNHVKETGHIKRIATKWFGPEHVSEEDLPLTASEDFGYFIREKPGCFFALGTLKPGNTVKTLHTSDYDFNDDMVATGAFFWVRLIEDRLGVSILKH